MASFAIVVKNTFLDAEVFAEGIGAGRARSLPARLQSRELEEGRNAVARHLACLNGIAVGDLDLCEAPSWERPEASLDPGVVRAAEVAASPSPPEGAATGHADASEREVAEGTLTRSEFSVGSWGHAVGRCRPCAFVRTAAKCRAGAMCTFCHSDGHPPQVTTRPCKAKRKRLRQAVGQMEAIVAQDPDVLISGRMKLPSILEKHPKERQRAMRSLVRIASDACSRAAEPTSVGRMTPPSSSQSVEGPDSPPVRRA